MWDMQADPKFQVSPAICPADIAPTSPRPEHLRYPHCSGFRAQSCFLHCTEHENAGACFSLGLAFRNAENFPDSVHYTMDLNQEACRLGYMNACVNILATAAKNTALPGFSDDCRMRTFQAACENGAPWGCTMLGWEYRRGNQLIDADMSQAIDFFQQACDLVPEGHRACQLQQ